MSQENPLAGGGSGTDSGSSSSLGQALEQPQAAPQPGQAPDTQTVPKSIPGSGQGREDWQAKYEQELARRSGTDKRYAADKRTWEEEREALVQQVKDIQTQLAQLTKQEAPAAEPAPQAPKPQAPKADVLDTAIEQAKASQYRDLLIDQMTRQGGPLQDLKGTLALFAENIPVHPPTLDSEGRLDDSAQRGAIEQFASALRGVQGQTQQQAQEAMLTGMTPGSAPGAPAPESAETVYQQFLDIMDTMGTKEFDQLDRTDQQRIEKQYYELLENPIVQEKHEGQTRPTMDWDEMQSTLRNLTKTVASMQAQGGPKGF